jgi:hypothetical protein
VSATVSTSTCTNWTVSDTSVRRSEAHACCPPPESAYGVACAPTGARSSPGAVLAPCAVCAALTDVPAHHARKEMSAWPQSPDRFGHSISIPAPTHPWHPAPSPSPDAHLRAPRPAYLVHQNLRQTAQERGLEGIACRGLPRCTWASICRGGSSKPKLRWNLHASRPPVGHHGSWWWQHVPRRGHQPGSATPCGSAA